MVIYGARREFGRAAPLTEPRRGDGQVLAMDCYRRRAYRGERGASGEFLAFDLWFQFVILPTIRFIAGAIHFWLSIRRPIRQRALAPDQFVRSIGVARSGQGRHGRPRCEVSAPTITPVLHEHRPVLCARISARRGP